MVAAPRTARTVTTPSRVYDAAVTTATWGDCERIGHGWLDQPVNAWSSLAFAVVGVGVAVSGRDVTRRERVDRIVFGLLLVATGAGSFVFHRSPDAAYWHDVTLLAALWFLGAANLTGALSIGSAASRTLEAGGIAILALVVVLAPSATSGLTAALIVALVALDVVLWRRTPPVRTWYAVALAGALIGVVAYVGGRTGSPLCVPGSLIQLHGVWHLLAAVSLGAYFVATTPVRNGDPT